MKECPDAFVGRCAVLGAVASTRAFGGDWEIVLQESPRSPIESHRADSYPHSNKRGIRVKPEFGFPVES